MKKLFLLSVLVPALTSCSSHPQKLLTVNDTLDAVIYKVKLTEVEVSNRSNSLVEDNLIPQGDIKATFEIFDIREARPFLKNTIVVYADSQYYYFDQSLTDQQLEGNFYTKISIGFKNVPLDNTSVSIKFSNGSFYLLKGKNY